MYAILGATGKVGGAAVRDLRRRGLTVRAIVRDAMRATHLAESGCEIVVADVHDADGLQAALAGASEVLVICPMNPKAEDAPAEHARMIGAIGIALEHVKPHSIVAISDYGAHHRTGTGVTLTFHLLEQRLRSIPVPCTFLRSAEHMQNWSRFLESAAQTGVLPIFYRPNTKFLPLVSAPDVGIVAADLLASPNQKREGTQIVHVEGPRRYSVDEVRETIEAVVGRPVEGRELTPESWVSALIQGGLSESYAQLVAGMYEAHNAGRIDIEPEFSEVRRGGTSLTEAFAALLLEHK
jgi:NAD(P)H dehydrogenase (quinone)